ncbi:MAG: hypothetical protein WDW36_009640 [Sanguina aurantia]
MHGGSATFGVPRLFDLVKCKDERLRVAFYYAMGNTLVAGDLEQASRIAYGGDRRFRKVVTLQGQLISDTGTMTGGGKPSRGRMTLGNAAPRNVDAQAANADLQAADEKLLQLSESLKAVRAQLQSGERGLRGAEAKLGELELTLPKTRMEGEAETRKADDIQAQMAQLRKATETKFEEVAQIEALQQSVDKAQAELAALKGQSAGLEKEAAALQAQIDSAGGDKLRKARAAVAALMQAVDGGEADIAKRGVQGKAGAKALAKLRKDMDKEATEAALVAAQVLECTTEITRLEDAGVDIQDNVAAAQEVVAAEGAALGTAKTERDRLSQEYGIIVRTEAEIVAKLEELRRIRKEEGAKVVGFKREIAGLAAKLAAILGTEVPPLTAEEMADPHQSALDATYLVAELTKLDPDMSAIAAFAAKEADFSAKVAELEGVTRERDETRKVYEGLRKSRLDGFMAGFNCISLKLKELYQMITLGGDAELELLDSLDPFSEGIVFSVRPPKKSWKNISNLSGGEKTLSSLSLVFALHHYKPTPLYVMDEIDAALDFKNVSIVGHYIKERTRNAQFVIISLRNNMFELADRLVGIYKTDDCTKTVTINPSEFVVAHPAPAAAAAGTGKGGRGTGADAESSGGQDQGMNGVQRIPVS